MNPEQPLIPLQIIVQKKSHAAIEDKIFELKGLSESFRTKTMKQASTNQPDPNRGDLLTQYFLNEAKMNAATVPANRTMLKEPVVLINDEPHHLRSISSKSEPFPPPQGKTIIVRQPAEEAKMQLGQTMQEFRNKLDIIDSLKEPEMSKISESLAELMEARKQKILKRDREKRAIRDQTRSKYQGRVPIEYLVNLDTHKTPKAFLTRRDLKQTLEPTRLIKCLEYGCIPEPEKTHYSNNNRVAFNRLHKWRPAHKRSTGFTRQQSSYHVGNSKEIKFTIVKKLPEEYFCTVKRVFIWEPTEEEEAGIRGMTEFLRESIWRMTLFDRAVKANAEKVDALEESRMTDIDLQNIIDEQKNSPEVVDDLVDKGTGSVRQDFTEKLREDINSLRGKAEKRRMKRDERHRSNEQTILLSTFANINDGLEYLEFPKHGKQKKIVIAADDDDTEHGTTTYYGTIQKRRATSNKFHPRWLVLKGFSLYWYRTSDSKTQKGVIKIGNKAPTETFVNELKCFNIEEGEGRLLTFLNNENGHAFMIKVGNQIYLRQYFEEQMRNEREFDKKIVEFFADQFAPILKLDSNANLTNETIHCISDSLELHPKLQEIELVQCDITDDQLSEIRNGMERGNNITKLNLAYNKITSKSAKTLGDIIRSPRNKKLMSLILDNNNILDTSLLEIEQALADKYTAISEEKSNTYVVPIELLSLKRTGIGDSGLKKLVNTFDSIAGRNRLNNEDYENMISLDVSGNEITNSGLQQVAQILPKFNAIYSLKLASLPRCKTSGFIELVKALRNSQSLQELDITENSLQNNVITELYSVLQENYILKSVKISYSHTISPILGNPPENLQRIYVMNFSAPY